MKKVMFMFATLLIGGLMLMGCKKTEPTPTPTPDPEPTPTTVSVVYQVVGEYQSLVMSDCFKLNVTYADANGESVTETGVTLPGQRLSKSLHLSRLRCKVSLFTMWMSFPSKWFLENVMELAFMKTMVSMFL